MAESSNTKYKYFSLSAIIFFSIASIALSLKYIGPHGGVIMILATSSILWITKSAWLPENYGKNRIRLYSLFIILTIVAPAPLYTYLINEYLFKFTLNIETIWLDKLIYAGLAGFGIWTVNFNMRDRTGMVEHPKKLETDFQSEPSFKTRFLNFSKVLKSRIERIDLETILHNIRFCAKV
jgi:hypothetical protein